jgi:pyruvate/2-oxoacid:ferredoxin oxidoreductase beta subunit
VNCFTRALENCKVNLDKVAIVSGIGCTGRVAGYTAMDSFHTTHGRAIPFATGLKLAMLGHAELYVDGQRVEAGEPLVAAGTAGENGNRLGAPRMAVALAWLLQRPGVVAPIVGASKPQHLRDALAALDVRLDAETVTSLEEVYVPHAVAGMAR